MKETTKNEIVRLSLAGTSKRRIARLLGIDRKTVAKVLDQHRLDREEGTLHADLPRPPKRRSSKLDLYRKDIEDLLERYPGIKAQRLLEELQNRGFGGGYTIVKELLREIRPRPATEPVDRFETAPGLQAQMDYSPYKIDFTREGPRLVHAFSYVLAYSRRQYLRFVESQDYPTTIREHQRAFARFGGLAAVCLYDNMKTVVDRWEDDEPVYNRRFLAFATHYGFRPWACKRGRAKTKGKVERAFCYVETNLLNARTFRDLEHLNEVAAWWLDHRADVRVHAELGERPIDRFAREQDHLLEAPATPYDTAQVVYRSVNSEGYIRHRQNHYSVPCQRVGEELPVRITEDEIIAYGPDLREIARHRLFPLSVTRQKKVEKAHRPEGDGRKNRELFRARFAELGPECEKFFESLVEHHRYGNDQARKILTLLSIYAKKDIVRALELARYHRAFSFGAVERILAARARPRPHTDRMCQQARDEIEKLFDQPSVSPRPAAEYQMLFDVEEEDAQDEQPDRAE